MTLYDEMLAAGLVVGHHASDLYVKDTPEAWAILAPHLPTMSRPQRFKSNIEGEGMCLDIPFGYTPFWDAVNAKVEARKVNA